MAKAKVAATIKCTECGKEFKNPQGLSGHLRLKHGKQSDAEYFGELYEDWLKVKDDLNEFLAAEAHCRKVSLGWSRQKGVRLTDNELERMIDILLSKGVGFPEK